MARRYHRLADGGHARQPLDDEELTEAEEELLALLKSRGVRSICASISKEINYVWAVVSGFRTLAHVGNFYFACGSQTFGYNPALDFCGAQGMQLALFALQKFVHNEHVLVPVLDCIHIYAKLHVDGAVDFLAVADAKEIVMKCVRFHDNKHDIIAAACQALGSLVLNDLVKESLSTPELVQELLGLISRYSAVLAICRAAVVPLGFLVTDPAMTAAFVDGNGITLTMSAMKTFIKDTELVWHVIGLLNGLSGKTLDMGLVFAVFDGTGVSRIVEAVASHLDTEEVAVEGFQLLARLAALPNAFHAVNESKVLDLAYIALFAYSGKQHRHTRLAIKRTLHAFQKCALYDPRELSRREQASRTDLILYALLVVCFLLSSAFAIYDREANDLAQSVRRIVQHSTWWESSGADSGLPPRARSLDDTNSIGDVWSYLSGPLHNALFQDSWYNGDSFAEDVESQLGVVDRVHVLLGGVQLRLVRVKSVPCPSAPDTDCFPPYSAGATNTQPVSCVPFFEDKYSTSDATVDVQGQLAVYSSGGYRRFLPRLSVNNSASLCNPGCQLELLRRGQWLDRSSRALFVNFNLYNPAVDLHCRVQLLFEFPAAGGVLASVDVVPLHLRQYPGLFMLGARFYVEIVLLVGVCWFAAQQFDKLQQYRWFYFIVPRHVLDFAIVVLWAAIAVVRVQSLTAASYSLQHRLTSNSAYVELDANVGYLRTERALQAWCAALMWWRLFRLAKCFKPLERTLIKFERAQTMITSYVWLLALYVVGFSHAAVLLFDTTAPATAGYRSFGTAIATLSSAAVKRWDNSARFSNAPLDGFGLAFELLSLFVVLGFSVAILRERFDSSRVHPTSRSADKLQLLEIAKQRLESHGMRVRETSLAQKLRTYATKGLVKLQSATRGVLAIPDDDTELLDLRRAWGLHGRDDSTSIGSSHDPDNGQPNIAGKRPLETITSLYAAEERDRELEQRLAEFALRTKDITRHLELFQRFVVEELMCSEAEWLDVPSRPVTSQSVTDTPSDELGYGQQESSDEITSHPPPPDSSHLPGHV